MVKILFHSLVITHTSWRKQGIRPYQVLNAIIEFLKNFLFTTINQRIYLLFLSPPDKQVIERKSHNCAYPTPRPTLYP